MDLDRLAVKDGFRLRGQAVTRLETFVDAAFAFAVTLLVVSFNEVPGTFAELVAAMKKVPAFLAGFTIVAMFWTAHNRFSRRFGLEDGPVVFLSFSLVAVVLVYIFPLRILMSSTMDFFSGGWLPSELRVQSARELRAFYCIYGVGFLVMSGVIALLNRHALRHAALLRLSAGECWLVRSECNDHLILGGSALISILLAALCPMTVPWQFALPGLAYALLALAMPWHSWVSARGYRRLLEQGGQAR